MLISVTVSLRAEWVQAASDIAEFIHNDPAVAQKEGKIVVLYLMEWGFMQNGEAVDPHDWSKENQIWYVIGDRMYHMNTGEGNCLYDATVKGRDIFLKNQRVVDSANKEKPKNPSYDGWLNLSYVDSQNPLRIFTIDNLGVYRIFMLMPLDI